MVYLVTAIVAYFLGSIPTGYLVAKAKGIDIRSVGSGNIGATNVFRILGKGPGIFVLSVDALKGFLAVGLVANLVWQFLGDQAAGGNDIRHHLKIVAGICAVLGHNYTCWLKFKGGKGIATSAGVLIGLVPYAFLVALATWLIVFFASKYVSLASILAAVVLPFATWQLHGRTSLIVITTVMSVLAIYKHRANIQRLRAGTENRIGGNKTKPPA
ncbi:MAG TPA: glycerol-3-phosphate 1-O-acyltransferase PlsY [Verrucomicrobiae bacterium]